MTLEDKILVYKDLSARLPYNVKILRHWIAPMSGSEEETIARFNSNDVEILSSSIQLDGDDGCIICDDGSYRKVRKYSCKPYLRSMSSMTKSEYSEYHKTFRAEAYGHGYVYVESFDSFNWLNEHHFDYRGLIDKGLALEAPKNMY